MCIFTNWMDSHSDYSAHLQVVQVVFHPTVTICCHYSVLLRHIRVLICIVPTVASCLIVWPSTNLKTIRACNACPFCSLVLLLVDERFGLTIRKFVWKNYNLNIMDHRNVTDSK